jgi:hypothetical protein
MLAMDIADFRYMLYMVLTEEQLVAVVRLGPEWFGLLSVATTGKRSNLILSVLEHGANIPWLGPIASLVEKPPEKKKKKKSVWSKDKLGAKAASEQAAIEPSYATERLKSNPHIRSAESLQQDLGRCSVHLMRGVVGGQVQTCMCRANLQHQAGAVVRTAARPPLRDEGGATRVGCLCRDGGVEGRFVFP